MMPFFRNYIPTDISCYRSPLRQTTTHNKKSLASALPCSSGHYAATGQIAIARWRTPTKLTGDPDLPLHNTPSEAICASRFTLHLMSSLLHRSEFIYVSIVIVASSSIGAGMTMKPMQGV